MTYDESYWDALRRKALQQYAGQSAQNVYQRYLAETRGQRPITELQEAAFGAR